MIRYFIILLGVITSLNLSAQIFDPDRPMIMPFIICVDSINAQMHDNLRNPPHDDLTETYGWVEIPNTYYQHNGKSLGMIITFSAGYDYMAFDARCPHCFYDDEIDDSKMYMHSRLSAVCPTCHAEAMNLVVHGTSQITRYNHQMTGPQHMNVYSTKVIKKGKKTYLRIANQVNGAWDEWRDLPENKFLLDVDYRND